LDFRLLFSRFINDRMGHLHREARHSSTPGFMVCAFDPLHPCYLSSVDSGELRMQSVKKFINRSGTGQSGLEIDVLHKQRNKSKICV
jgi:hypothetical protein